MENSSVRFIGIRHRIKVTADGEARPTQLFIIDEADTVLDDGDERVLELATEDDELDFALARLPLTWKTVETYEEVKQYPPHHRQSRLKPGSPKFSEAYDDYTWKVPATYTGLQPGDTVAMVLGGSGDNFAFALSRKSDEIDAKVLRIPPFLLKKERTNGSKDEDAGLLARLAQEKPELFYVVTPRDRSLIGVSEAIRARTDAMKDRIACEQRLRQRTIGLAFRSQDGLFPEGSITVFYDNQKASDAILKALETEEGRREREVAKALVGLDVWEQVLNPVEGCGPLIGARIIAAIIDIRRFERKEQLVAFCGVHVLTDGAFVRRRKGQTCNWHPDARQALYLLGDQMVRRKESVWGQKLLDNKAKFRERHPEPIRTSEGKLRYNNGHIHKMAIWRTITQFVKWLHAEWWKLEGVEESTPVEMAS